MTYISPVAGNQSGLKDRLALGGKLPGAIAFINSLSVRVITAGRVAKTAGYKGN